jgi:hypothetical protein
MMRATVMARAYVRPAAATAAVAHVGPHSYVARYQAKLAEEGNVLVGPEYSFLQRQLAGYKLLQNEYAVKQNDIERAKKAAEVCGLKFTDRASRKK